MEDEDFFEKEKKRMSAKGDEQVWQNFFEKNTWILGYGLNFIFNTPLEDKKLEQVVKGYDVFSRGKRVDSLGSVDIWYKLAKCQLLNSIICNGRKFSHFLKPARTFISDRKPNAANFSKPSFGSPEAVRNGWAVALKNTAIGIQFTNALRGGAQPVSLKNCSSISVPTAIWKIQRSIRLSSKLTLAVPGRKKRR